MLVQAVRTKMKSLALIFWILQAKVTLTHVIPTIFSVLRITMYYMCIRPSHSNNKHTTNNSLETP